MRFETILFWLTILEIIGGLCVISDFENNKVRTIGGLAVAIAINSIIATYMFCKGWMF